MKFCKDCKYFNKDNSTCNNPNVPHDMVSGERETWTAIHSRLRPLTGCGEEAKWYEELVDLDDYTSSLFNRVGVSS